MTVSVEYKSARRRYRFNFDVRNFPDIFDKKVVDEFGIYSHTDNPEGLTKDHKLSVADAYVNNYDPYYIRHPVNCQLMTNNANREKGNTSSIKYDDLVEQVDEYDDKKFEEFATAFESVGFTTKRQQKIINPYTKDAMKKITVYNKNNKDLGYSNFSIFGVCSIIANGKLDKLVEQMTIGYKLNT